jgi:hypothetical protein
VSSGRNINYVSEKRTVFIFGSEEAKKTSRKKQDHEDEVHSSETSVKFYETHVVTSQRVVIVLRHRHQTLSSGIHRINSIACSNKYLRVNRED